MALTIQLGETEDSNDFRTFVERGFREQLELLGVDIVCNGFTEKCIIAPIETLREKTDSGGYTPHNDTRVDMLAADFDTFGEIIINVTEVTIEDVAIIILRTKSDPMDPVIYFEVSSGY